MTYDHWKTTEPDTGWHDWRECDCCGKVGPVTRCWYAGIETFACDDCQGIETPDEKGDDAEFGMKP